MRSFDPNGTRLLGIPIPSLKEIFGMLLLYVPLVGLSLPPDNSTSISDPFGIALAVIVAILLHEASHALAHLLLTGALPGVGLGPYYVGIVTRGPITVRKLVLIASSPLILSIPLYLFVVLLGGVWSLIYFLNLVGACSDIILILEILPLPADAAVVDSEREVLVVLPEGWSPPPPLLIIRPFLRKLSMILPILLLLIASFGLQVTRSVMRQGSHEVHTLTLSLDPSLVVAAYALGIVASILLTVSSIRKGGANWDLTRTLSS